MKIRDWLGRLAYTLVQGSLDEDVEDVVYDSRKARPHTVFVCIRGSARDSHTFIPDVLEKGCRVLVTEKDVTVPGDVTVLRVENGRLALAELSAARFGYPAEKLVTIGITGTKGKTTTSYMVKAILEAAGKKVGLIGTNGAVIGTEKYATANTTPESYLVQEYFAKMVEAGCTHMVMEVSSQAMMLSACLPIFPRTISDQRSTKALRSISIINPGFLRSAGPALSTGPWTIMKRWSGMLPVHCIHMAWSAAQTLPEAASIMPATTSSWAWNLIWMAL